MTELLAVLDTDVAVLLLDTRSKPEESARARIQRARQAVADVKKKGARCLITTPTVVELAAWPKAPDQVRTRLRTLVQGLRHCALTVDGADAAGRILLSKLKPRPPGKGRDEIKFDALIAGIAHAADARWLITGNAKDMKPLLEAIGSPVQVLDVDAPPDPELRKQLTLDELGVKKK